MRGASPAYSRHGYGHRQRVKRSTDRLDRRPCDPWCVRARMLGNIASRGTGLRRSSISDDDPITFFPRPGRGTRIDARPNQRRQCAQVISSALSRLEEGGARLWRPEPNGTPAMLRAGLLAVTLSLIAGSVDCGRQVQHRCLLDILSPEHDAPKHQCQKTAYVRRAAQRARTPQLHELHCYQGSSERSVRWPLLGTMASTSRMEANRRESPAVH